MIDKMLIGAYMLANLETVSGYMEEVLPLVGQVIDDSYGAELEDSINNGEITYHQLTQSLNDKLDWFMEIDWPEEWDEDEVIDQVPDHIWITFPGTELVLCDIMNAFDFFSGIDYSNFKNVVFKLGGVATDIAVFGWLYPFFSNNPIPFTRYLTFKDGASGTVGIGTSFTPEKNIKWVDAKPFILKGMTIGLIIYLIRKTGIVGKVWKLLQGGMNWRTKKMTRQTLTSLTSNNTTVNDSLGSLDDQIKEMDENVDSIKSVFDKAYSPQKGTLFF